MRIASALLLLGALQAAAQGSDPHAARIARIERDLTRGPIIVDRARTPGVSIEQRLKDLRIAGISIAVVDSGRVVWSRAWGVADAERNTPVTTGTLFQAASISKAIASMGTLRLVEQGKLALDRPVNDQLKSWKVPSNDLTTATPITLRHLLTHTGGLTVSGFPGYAATATIPTTVQILDGTAPANTPAVRVDIAPNSAWRYAGGGMTVAQLLMTDVTGESFPSLMKKLVLDPVGMTSSTYEQPLSPALASRAASAHMQDGTVVPGKWHVYPEMMAAGLWTTPTDLGKWVIEVQKAFAGRSSLLTQSTAREMLTSGRGNWGLGIQIEGTGDSLRFLHSGSNRGFRAMMIGWATGGQGVVLMTNSDAGGAIAEELIGAIAREYRMKGRTQEYRPIALAESAAREMAGNYRLGTNPAPMVVVYENGALWATPGGATKYELIPVAPDQFISLPAGPVIRFQRDAAGKVVALMAGNTRAERLP